MRVSVLASGSKGNSTFIEEENTRILVDLGVSCDYVESKLKELDVEPESIKAILITHTHSDHINGLTKFYRKYKPTIYVMPRMMKDLNNYVGIADYQYFDDEKTLIDDISLNIVKTSHDAPDSVGFVINDRLVYITDTGYLNEKYHDGLKNKEIYILESNHDIEMLMNGSYPYYLKQRILSDKGHLSNKVASEYLSKLIGKRTKTIVLAHLSEENNSPEAALSTLLEYVPKKKVDKIIIATQKERTELVEV